LRDGCGYVLLYEVATVFPFKKRTQNLRFRALQEYENVFAHYGSQLIFSFPTDTSFLLILFSLRKFSTTLKRNEAYSYWTKRNRSSLLQLARSMTSKAIARIAGYVDYTLGKTPLVCSPR
jgi:hypothetical protein